MAGISISQEGLFGSWIQDPVADFLGGATPITPFAEDIPVMKSYREVIYDYLRKAIIKGELPSGTQITDSELAERFGVSRMPVREALRKLEAEGLIERKPGKGTVVTGITREEIAHIFAIRKAIEGLAVRYAARKISADELGALRDVVREAADIRTRLPADALAEALIPLAARFNRILIDACRIPRLIALIWTHRDYLQQFSVVRVIISARLWKSFETRERLLGLLESGNEDAACALWQEHLDASFRSFFEAIDMEPGQDYV